MKKGGIGELEHFWVIVVEVMGEKRDLYIFDFLLLTLCLLRDAQVGGSVTGLRKQHDFPREVDTTAASPGR